MGNGKHYVYILRCNDGTYYTGYTNDLEKRLNKHQAGKGAKYTRGRTPVQLIFSQEYDTKTEAMHAEYRIKQLTREQKEAYINKKISVT
ncbi:GIY-YIG nuclease family protein [Calidifontibacillus oryziterrae]|uniref:GIY-YIG nuclease family protein n=1 Tax=Calidifontibacillus oryziterrae TaxID=1191699 RepID=UPI0004776C26|nr:GIY-YIG nuclease family protein [Calidifontibacillus oryziterrae]